MYLMKNKFYIAKIYWDKETEYNFGFCYQKDKKHKTF